MGLTSAEMKRLLDCGVTPEALLIVTEIIEERDGKRDARVGDRDAAMSNAERSRAYRQRKRDAVVTAVTKPRDDSVTLPPTPPLKVISEVKEVSEGKEVKGIVIAPARTGTRLPLDFEPDESCKRVARELNYTNGQWKACLTEFRDYWAGVPGAKGRKLDWQATFRNRLRNFIERKPYGKSAGGEWKTAFDDLETRLVGDHPPDDGGNSL